MLRSQLTIWRGRPNGNIKRLPTAEAILAKMFWCGDHLVLLALPPIASYA